MRHTMGELRQWQSLPLPVKIRMTETRIRGWVHEFGEDGVYVSFSGGKDSTVLLDIVRNKMGYKNIPAVFVDTGLEYPEIREFVKTFENVVWLKPEMNFRQVIEKYGYPFISKEISNDVANAREFLRNPEKFANRKPIPVNIGDKYRPYSLEKLEGTLRDGKSFFNERRWRFLIDADFNISGKCCNVMKKNPAYKYGKETGRKPITAQMAAESRLRTKTWLQNGCNAFDSAHPISNPMSFWTEQDVLQYVKENDIKIASVYGDVVADKSEELKTTGCSRTGCMFCGFGCHLDEKGKERFVLMKKTHPAQYEWIMKEWSRGGLDYKNVIDWINEHGNLDIKY